MPSFIFLRVGVRSRVCGAANRSPHSDVSENISIKSWACPRSATMGGRNSAADNKSEERKVVFQSKLVL